MRGNTLTNLRTLLKAKLREAQETNTASDAEFDYALIIKQQVFAQEYDWGFLRRTWNSTVAAGTRYVDFPTADIRGATASINFDRPVQVTVLRSTSYLPVVYGIDDCEMNVRNSDLDQRQDPIQRWSIDTNTGDTSNDNEFEVWPIPQTAQTMRFRGQRQVRTFATGTDKADLDDILLVLFVAAEYLADRKNPKAGIVLKEANDRLIKLRAGFSTVFSPIVFGRNQQMRQETNVKLIAIA